MKQILIYEIALSSEEEKVRMIAEIESVLAMQPTRIEEREE